MNSELKPATAGFALAAAVTILFSTALAWAKDKSPGLNDFMTSLAGHNWITHGLSDLALFACLGLIFTAARVGARMDPNRVIAALVASVIAGALGLVLWFAFT